MESYWGHADPIGVRSCYDEEKCCAETLFFDYYQQHKLRIKVARIFNTYGPRMHPNDGRMVSNFIIQSRRNEPITIYGDGNQSRSFCYVDDQVEAVVRFIDSPDDFTGRVNLGNPTETSIVELAKTIIKLMNSNSKLDNRPLPPDDPKQYCPDISLAGEKMDWQPTTSLKDGLKKTIDYFDKVINRENLPV